MPAPDEDAVAPPTPIVVPNDGVVRVANVAVAAGNVSVFVPATAGAASVILPDVSPEITTEDILNPYRTTQRLPLGTVTVTPLDTVTAPTDEAE